MTAYCMAFSKCCRKLAKWGSGYVLFSYPRIRKKCIQERIQSLLTTDYRLLQILNCISNTFYLLTAPATPVTSNRSCWTKNILPQPRIKLRRGLYVFSIQICIFCIVFLYYSVLYFCITLYFEYFFPYSSSN